MLLPRRHRCPHRPHGNIMNLSSNFPCPLTEYNQQFKKFSGKPRESLRPPQKRRTYDCKTEYKTVHSQDYISHPITPTPSRRPTVVYKRPEGKVEGTTEYKKQYQGRWAHPAAAVRPVDARKDSAGTFDHRSTQRMDFVAFPLPPREFHGERRLYEPPTEPFDGRSTVQSDFVDFGKVDLVPSLKPPQVPKISTDPFDDTTSYRHSFTPLPIPKRFQRKRQAYTPSHVEFDGTTTFKTDYPTHTGVTPTQSMRPPQKAVASDVPFEGTTTSRLSYQPWELQLPARQSRPHRVYTPPQEFFSTQSTFKADYPDYGRVELTRSLRPQPRPKDQVAPFEALTTQGMDFKAWTDVKRPPLINREKKYEPPVEKFDATSTFQAHYRGEFAPRASLVKPPVASRVDSSKMECSTAYREGFSPGAFKPCPAIFLCESGKPEAEFVYSHQDATTGHKYYSPVKDTQAQRDVLDSSLVTAQA